VSEQAEQGIQLSCMNFSDEQHRQLAQFDTLVQHGNGKHILVSNEQYPTTILMEMIGGRAIRIENDRSVSLRFNPDAVESYRLVGHEKRTQSNIQEPNQMTNDNWTVGGAVTNFYEVVFYENKPNPTDKVLEMTLVYKEVGRALKTVEMQAILFDYQPLKECTTDTRWAVTIAAWGMLLQDSDYAKRLNMNKIIRWATDIEEETGDWGMRGCLNTMKEYKSMFKYIKNNKL